MNCCRVTGIGKAFNVQLSSPARRGDEREGPQTTLCAYTLTSPLRVGGGSEITGIEDVYVRIWTVGGDVPEETKKREEEERERSRQRSDRTL